MHVSASIIHAKAKTARATPSIRPASSSNSIFSKVRSPVDAPLLPLLMDRTSPTPALSLDGGK